MKKEKSLLDMRPVRVGTFRQNCYRVDSRDGIRKHPRPNVTKETYISQEKVLLPNGFVEELVEKTYPINSDSVSSYAEGADYRNDPAQAIANASQRVNLGDITAAQEFLKNPQNNAKMFNEIKSKLEAYYSAITQLEKEKSIETGSEVKADGNEV